MASPYKTGAEGEKLLAAHLTKKGHKVQESPDKTFDLIVDGVPAEVKSSQKAYDKLQFFPLTQNQYRALDGGVEFNVYLVCNLQDPSNLEIITLSSDELRTEEPEETRTYYWYRDQVERIRQRREPGSS